MAVKDLTTKTGKITLDMELKDLLDLVSKADPGPPPISDSLSDHSFEGEDIKKAWFKHLLISLEKLNDLIEVVRRVDIVNLRNEFKAEMSELERKYEKSEDDLKSYKKDIVDPMNTKLIVLAVKISVWSVLGGVLGSGVAGLVFYAIKEYWIKPSIAGGS